MDWLNGMNNVVKYIEENLTNQIQYEALSRIVGCSVYEFSRIFSFMVGMSVSEYIRRRRLSQAVFDLQNSNDKIVDIALKYCYESPTTFTRAFKELHGTAPSTVRKMPVSLKTYPPITFLLTIKGVTAMDFRIEQKESFQVIGLLGYDDVECKPDGTQSPLWREFVDKYWNGEDDNDYCIARFCRIAVYYFQADGGKTKVIIGAEFKGKKSDNMAVETIPDATWAVFPITSPTGAEHVSAAYTRIMTEWFPASQYRRDESVPGLEVFPEGDTSSMDYTWEIWIPVTNK